MGASLNSVHHIPGRGVSPGFEVGIDASIGNCSARRNSELLCLGEFRMRGLCPPAPSNAYFPGINTNYKTPGCDKSH